MSTNFFNINWCHINMKHIRVLRKSTRKLEELSFLDAPGGTGNTFVTILLLANIRKQSKIAIAVACHSTLLSGCHTAYSALKLPLNLSKSENPLSNIKKATETANVLQQCLTIVWDECTMSHKLTFKALDRSLQDILDNNMLMGGVTGVIW